MLLLCSREQPLLWKTCIRDGLTHPEVLGENTTALPLPQLLGPSQQCPEFSVTAECQVTPHRCPHNSPMPQLCCCELCLPPSVWSHLPFSLGRRRSGPSHQHKTRVQIYLYSVPDKSLQGWRGLHGSLWLVAFRLQTFSSHARCPFPLCLSAAELPRAEGGGDGCTVLTSPLLRSAPWHLSCSLLMPSHQCLQV